MSRPRALDLFCCAGGASEGLRRAGFDVYGVDIVAQPRYQFEFLRADALSLPPMFFTPFSLIWASPPCQAHTQMKTLHNAKPHIDLIPQTRALLESLNRPYVIENVIGAPLVNPLMLCGTMFDLGVVGAELQRHRLFECSGFHVEQPKCNHTEPEVIGVYGGHARNRKRDRGPHNGAVDFTTEDAEIAMGISWMTLGEISQAIPPAYAEYIGIRAMRAIKDSERKSA